VVWIHVGSREELLFYRAAEKPNLFCEQLPQHPPILVSEYLFEFEVLIAIGRRSSEPPTNTQSLSELSIHLATSTRRTLKHRLRSDGVLDENLQLIIRASANCVKGDDASD
jgi:hypothetical protein